MDLVCHLGGQEEAGELDALEGALTIGTQDKGLSFIILHQTMKCSTIM
jgi:hypothetical protein